MISPVPVKVPPVTFKLATVNVGSMLRIPLLCVKVPCTSSVPVPSKSPVFIVGLILLPIIKFPLTFIVPDVGVQVLSTFRLPVPPTVVVPECVSEFTSASKLKLILPKVNRLISNVLAKLPFKVAPTPPPKIINVPAPVISDVSLYIVGPSVL